MHPSTGMTWQSRSRVEEIDMSDQFSWRGAPALSSFSARRATMAAKRMSLMRRERPAGLRAGLALGDFLVVIARPSL